VQQFVNKVQLIATITTPKNGSQATKKTLVEHKELGCAAARFGWCLFAALALFAGCVSKKCIPLGMRDQFVG
jgi:hypothetical protein